MKKNLFLNAAFLAVYLALSFGIGHADTVITGNLWYGNNAKGQNYIDQWSNETDNTNTIKSTGGHPLTNGQFSFNTTGSNVDFSFGPGPASGKETYGSWLNNNATWVGGQDESNVNFVTGSNNPFFSGPKDGNGRYVGTFFKLTWTQKFNSSVTDVLSLTHDDGATLWISTSKGSLGTKYINSPAPTASTTGTTNFTFDSGTTYYFTLTYGGVNGFPEVLNFSETSAAVPEPTTLILLSLALVCLTGFKFRGKIAG